MNVVKKPMAALRTYKYQWFIHFSCNTGYRLGNDRHSCYGRYITDSLSWSATGSCIIGSPLHMSMHRTDIDECQEGIHQCTQTCNNTNSSYMCQCNAGYTLGIDETTCHVRSPSLHFASYDVARIITTTFSHRYQWVHSEETGGCAQDCTNTDGSYACTCNLGYCLGSDGYSCYGTKLVWLRCMLDIDECQEGTNVYQYNWFIHVSVQWRLHTGYW